MKRIFLLSTLMVLAYAKSSQAQIYYQKVAGGGVSIPAPNVLLANTTVTPDTVITDKGTAASDPYAARLHYIFQFVDRTPVTTGLLLDYGVNFANPATFAGVLTDTNQVDITTWRSLFAALQASRFNNNFTLPTLSQVNTTLDNVASATVDLPVLHVNYQTLRPDAISANLMTVTNDQLYDVAGRTQSPYLLKTAFAISPTKSRSHTNNLQFIFRSQLFFNNTGKTLTTRQVDLNDGRGYLSVAWDTPIPVNYTTTGTKLLRFKFTYSDGTVAESKAWFIVDNITSSPTARYDLGPDITQPLIATRDFQGVFGTGVVSVDLGDGNNVLDRPLIVVEGYDPWRILSPNDPTENYSYQSFILQLNAQLLNTGVFELSDQLDRAGYDLVFVDFDNGTDFIERNAFLLERVIEWVNQQKAAAGSTQPNVIMGMSMGGLVARYALADMRLRGLNAQTRLLITHDSPHQGANAPLGFQQMVNSLNGRFNILGIRLRDIVPILPRAVQLLNEPASRQMLIVQQGQANTWLAGDYRTMINRDIGCRMVATSNGSECGAGPSIEPYSELLRVKGNFYVSRLLFGAAQLVTTGASYILPVVGPVVATIASVAFIAVSPLIGKDWQTEFVVNALPDRQVQRIYYGNVKVVKKVLFVIPISINLFNDSGNSMANLLPWDSAAGGVYDIKGQASTPNNPNINLLPLASVNLTVQLNNFCFVPTRSALDVDAPNPTVTVASLRAVYSTGQSPRPNTPFASFVTALRANEEHIQFTNLNA